MKKCLTFTLLILATLTVKAQLVNGPSSPFGSNAGGTTSTASVAAPSIVSQSGTSPGMSTFPLDRNNSAHNNYNYGNVSTSSNYANSYGKESPWMGERFFRDTAFHQGELRTRKDLFTNELGYRYDQIEGAIEIKLENGKRMYLYDKDILYCKLFFYKHTAVFMPVILPNDNQMTLVEVIYKTPTLQLYRNLHKINTVGASYIGQTDVVDKTKDDYQYYFKKGDKEVLKEVSITAKSFINMLPNKKHYIVALFKAEEGKGKLSLAKLSEMMKKLDEIGEDN
jgi:hypothetical protein